MGAPRRQAAQVSRPLALVARRGNQATPSTRQHAVRLGLATCRHCAFAEKGSVMRHLLIALRGRVLNSEPSSPRVRSVRVCDGRRHLHRTRLHPRRTVHHRWRLSLVSGRGALLADVKTLLDCECRRTLPLDRWIDASTQSTRIGFWVWLSSSDVMQLGRG